MDMRKFFAAVAVVFAAALSASAQEFQPRLNLTFGGKRKAEEVEKSFNYHNLRIAYGRFAVWQKTFPSEFSSADEVARKLFEKGLFSGISVVDGSTVRCNYCWSGAFPYKALGVRYGQLPLFLVNAEALEARLVFQLKGGACRVTADRLHIVKDAGKYGKLHYYGDVFVDDDGEFIESKTLPVACEIIDAMLQDAVDFSKPGYLAPDF